jgi:hypothetical protein
MITNTFKVMLAGALLLAFLVIFIFLNSNNASALLW